MTKEIPDVIEQDVFGGKEAAPGVVGQICPRCMKTLTETDIWRCGKTILYRCSDCKGRWLPVDVKEAASFEGADE